MASIGLDFDGVITNCGRLKSFGAQKLFNISIPEDYFKRKLILQKKLLTPEQYTELQKYVYGSMEMLPHMEEVFCALTSIRALQKQHHVVVVTSRTGHFANVARKWLEQHLLPLEVRETEYGKTKKGGTSGIDVFVDDDTEKLTELIGHVPHLFLFDWPYNREEILPPQLTRVSDWEYLVEKIKTSTYTP